MSDAFAQKVGRGGAGNFYTKAAVEAALRNSSPPERSSGSFPLADTQTPTYVRIGRGGLGNFIVPTEEIPTSSSDAKSDQSTGEAVDASSGKLKEKIANDKITAYRGLSGRGGMGNWRQGNDEAGRKRTEDEEMKIRSRLDERVKLEVEMGLKLPPKVHAAPRNTKGRPG